jgi:signal transduction histidine kinase/response regulator RpfG family c-di-GMP phosphodiesterase
MATDADWSQRNPRTLAALCAALAAAVALVDAVVPANVLVPMIYVVPISLCLWVRSTRWLWALTAACILALTITHLVGRGPSLAGVESIAHLNHLMVAAVLVAIAGHAHLKIVIEAALAERERQLDLQRVEVEAVNEELRQREEEIIRQNEELHSQTEELERQTEELRATNEELQSRERSLEQLLELSRALTAEMTRSEVLDKVCEALGGLTDGGAAAILERRGNDMKIVCHHGFGHAGVMQVILPAADTFASLVMSQGQTGYLADVALRPELVLPAPAEGPPFGAVLATPLRVQNRSIGTVEIYAAQPRTWDALQVAIIESLAAQLSISLQSLELVEATRQERRRFEAAFRTVPFGMAITDDPLGEDLQLNPAAAAIFGVPVGENLSSTTPLGVRIRKAATRAHVPVEENDLPISRALRGEEVIGDELDFALPKGTISLLCCAAPILDSQQRIAGAVASYADISQLKGLQRELERRRREAEEASVRKTRFLAAVSHDIRTPANAISLMAELIRRSTDNPELHHDLPELADQLQNNTHALMELVGDVLDLARFDTGKVELVETEFSLVDLINDEVRQVRPLADNKKIDVVVEPAGRPIWLHTDRVKLGRVLGNLLGNAIKFTTQGSVRVSAQVLPAPDGRLSVHVIDTGVGIARENLSRIFDEFAQLHNPERDRNKGTGLGLAICSRLVEVMGGEIRVESEPGKGSDFEVLLPAASVALWMNAMLGSHGSPTGARGAALSPRAREPLALDVLLVEDHTSTREGTARILRQEGARVAEANNGVAALAAIEAATADVVLLDMMLPDMDGREILKRICERRPARLKGVLVLTGDLTPERLDEVKQLGADGLIGKPIDVVKLLAALERYQAGDSEVK